MAIVAVVEMDAATPVAGALLATAAVGQQHSESDGAEPRDGVTDEWPRAGSESEG